MSVEQRQEWTEVLDGKYLVHRYGIIGTGTDVIEVLEDRTPEHSTVTYRGDRDLGRLGTKSHSSDEYEESYMLIREVYPDVQGVEWGGTVRTERQ